MTRSVEAVAVKLLRHGRDVGAVARSCALSVEQVQRIAEGVRPAPARRLRGPDRQKRGKQVPDRQGRVAWFVGRVPADFRDRMEAAAAREGLSMRDFTVQLLTRQLEDRVHGGE